MTNIEFENKLYSYLLEEQKLSPSGAYDKAREVRKFLDTRDVWVLFRFDGNYDEFA